LRAVFSPNPPQKADKPPEAEPKAEPKGGVLTSEPEGRGVPKAEAEGWSVLKAEALKRPERA
jgi:hypothetical protein